MPPTKLPTTFSMKLLIVSSSKTWAGVLKRVKVPHPLDRSQGHTANLQQIQDTLPLSRPPATSRGAAALRAGLSS